MNGKRILLGALAGGLVWSGWSVLINFVILRPLYLAEGHIGQLLLRPRYGAAAFLISWFVTLFLVSGICSWLYAAVRKSRGPGPRTAVEVGVLVGFATAFPISLAVTNWSPLVRTIPLGWLVDLWVGAILATFVAGALYRDGPRDAASAV